MVNFKGLWIDRRGEIRLGWLLLTAAVLYVAAAFGIYELYWHLYRTMMEIWCVTAENIVRAPAAVQFLYSWSNVIVQVLQNVFLIGSAFLIARLAGVRKNAVSVKSGFLSGCGYGAAGISAIWLILMLTGSVRLGWRLSRPAFSVNTLAAALTTCAAALAEGCFFYGALYEGAKKRLPVWAALAVMAVLNVLFNGMFALRTMIGGMLMALVCCRMKDSAGVGAVIGFRFAWAFFDQGVFGFAGAAGALYETYPVNLYWLCGGSSGILSGALAPAALLMLAYWLARKTGRISWHVPKKRSKSPS